jgi:23S rRNA-/tRNA-specific pseudouridylate synthase
VSDPGDSFWAALPLGNGVKVIARDACGLAAVAKPAGVLSHPNVAGDAPRALLRARYDLAGEFFEWFAGTAAPLRLWLLNRLDSATSGVILVAADAGLAAAVKAGFKRKEVRKVYQALVFGVPREPVQEWRDRLAIEKAQGRIRSSAGGNVLAESRMRLVRAGRGEPRLSLLRLEPRTGRSHQLRVQCAKRGLPIVGDQTYGDFRLNRAFAKQARTKRMFLHSLETSFAYEYAGKTRHFSAAAPLPAEFEAFL